MIQLIGVTWYNFVPIEYKNMKWNLFNIDTRHPFHIHYYNMILDKESHLKGLITLELTGKNFEKKLDKFIKKIYKQIFIRIKKFADSLNNDFWSFTVILKFSGEWGYAVGCHSRSISYLGPFSAEELIKEASITLIWNHIFIIIGFQGI